MGSRQIRRLYRALPVFPYCHFRKAAPKGIPDSGIRCLAPTGSSLAKPSEPVLIFIHALYFRLLFSLPPPPTQVNRNT